MLSPSHCWGSTIRCPHAGAAFNGVAFMASLRIWQLLIWLHRSSDTLSVWWSHFLGLYNGRFLWKTSLVSGMGEFTVYCCSWSTPTGGVSEEIWTVVKFIVYFDRAPFVAPRNFSVRINMATFKATGSELYKVANKIGTNMFDHIWKCKAWYDKFNWEAII